MSSSAAVAVRTYLLPLGSTRALRLGMILLVFMLGLIGLAVGLRFAGPMLPFLPEDATPTALRNLRRFLVAPGLGVAAILFSDLALRDGIRQRTLLYPLLGPVSRRTLALVRTLVTAALLILGMVALVALTRLLEGAGWALFPREVLALTGGALAYVGVFGLVHLVTGRGLFAGLALFAFDFALAYVPFSLRRFSLSYHVRALADLQVDMELPVKLTAPETSLAVSMVVLLAVAAVTIFLTAQRFTRKNLGELC